MIWRRIRSEGDRDEQGLTLDLTSHERAGSSGVNTVRTADVRLSPSSIYIAVLSTVAVVLASKGISDEGTISLNGERR